MYMYIVMMKESSFFVVFYTSIIGVVCRVIGLVTPLSGGTCSLKAAVIFYKLYICKSGRAQSDG